MQILFDLTHARWIGQLGPTAMAALAGGSFLSWILYSLTQMLNTGMSALIARRMGEGHPDQAAAYARQGLVLSVVLGLGVSLLALWPMYHALGWMGLEPAVRADAWRYLRILILTFPLIWLYSLLQSIFAGRGDTRASLHLVTLALVLNMVLDPLLIYSFGLGISGAAWASTSARIAGIGLGLYLLWQENWLGWTRPDRDSTVKALRIGLPHAATGVIFCLVFVLLTPMVSRFGSPALAAWGVSQRLETVIYSVLLGFSVACSTLVGQNLGARQPERAEKLVWLASAQAAGFCALAMGLFWFGAPLVMPVFTSDPVTAAHGVAYLRTVGLTLIPYSFELVFEGAFAGAGNTLPPMLIIVIGTLLRLPLAWFFAIRLNFGAQGVWLAVATSMCLKGTIMMLWFRRGKWKDVMV